MGRMVRQREFIFYDPGDHRASPDTGAKAISHRAGLQNVGQLLALVFRNSRRAAGAVSFQDPLHPINLSTLQPQANVRAMNFKDISNFGSCSALHVESDGVKSVGDGAQWIWGIAEEHFYGAIQIVDLYHAREHLAVIAKIVYGASAIKSKEWMDARREELDAGDVEAVIASMRRLRPSHTNVQQEVRTAMDYFHRNAERMRYADFASRACLLDLVSWRQAVRLSAGNA
jgi:hypothetical protein